MLFAVALALFVISISVLIPLEITALNFNSMLLFLVNSGIVHVKVSPLPGAPEYCAAGSALPCI